MQMLHGLRCRRLSQIPQMQPAMDPDVISCAICSSASPVVDLCDPMATGVVILVDRACKCRQTWFELVSLYQTEAFVHLFHHRFVSEVPALLLPVVLWLCSPVPPVVSRRLTKCSVILLMVRSHVR